MGKKKFISNYSSVLVPTNELVNFAFSVLPNKIMYAYSVFLMVP